ncbi:hypothetical protein SSS_07322 [Sarcoptes scabiei]|nr:hypothetical protein SSS_07322 [Sarcoptes scabiei]
MVLCLFAMIAKFCQSKCHKNFKHKCNPRKKRWTKTFRKANGKELAFDKTFEFEKRRNIPVKYSRELWSKTKEAIEEINRIKEKRESHFIMKRKVMAEKFKREMDRKEVERDISLIRSKNAGLRVPRRRVKVIRTSDRESQKDANDEENVSMESDDSDQEFSEQEDLEAEAIMN